MGDLIIKSSAFREGENIPAKHTCDGDNVSPFLEIRGAPHETKSFVLVLDDPDATNGVVWDHWVMWNILPDTKYIAEDSIPEGAHQGLTSFGHMKYGGPCPPKGSAAHRYVFTLYAIDTMLDIPESSTKADVKKAIEGHVLDEAQLMGKYGR